MKSRQNKFCLVRITTKTKSRQNDIMAATPIYSHESEGDS